MPVMGSSKTVYWPPTVKGKTQMNKTSPQECSETVRKDRCIQDYEVCIIMKNSSKLSNTHEQSLGLVILRV